MNHFLFTLLYLDAGTGSMLIQFIVAIIAGIGFWGKSICKTIASWLKRDRKKD